MGISLRPCPNCSRPMETQRAVCVFCAQSGFSAPAPPTSPAPPPARVREVKPARSFLAFVLGALLPIGGLILGIAFAFHAEPERKQEAGFAIGGAIFGFVVGMVFALARG